jgi:hypothetical protein
MSRFPHLTPEAATLVDSSLSERLEFINRDHFLAYDLGDRYLRELEDLLSQPKSLRMPCRALIGGPQNGKTTLLKEFIRKHPPAIDAANHTICPVLFVEMPPEPDEGRFWSAILQSLLIVHNPAAVVEKLEAQAISNLIDLQVKVIVIDEFHNMLHGSAKDQRQFLAVVKSMANRLQVSLVIGGTIDASRALATDGQFVTRFEKFNLAKWSLNAEFRDLLATFETLLPLVKPSNLATKEKTIAIFNASHKTIGGVKKVLVKAATFALRSGEEEVTYDCLIRAIAEIEQRSMVSA